jgi:hypothetical protein
MGQGRRYRYIGIQPSAMIEFTSPYYPPAWYDFNLAPLVFETPINTVTDFKLHTQLMYRYPAPGGLSSVGVQLVFPRYFKAKQRFSETSKGWYLGPVIAGSRDFDRNLYHTDLGLEFGKMLFGDNVIGANLSIQAGAHYQWLFHKKNQIVPYAGVQIGLGGWFKQKLYFMGGSA